MAINKVIFGGNTLIDLSADTVTADKMLTGTTAHDKAGNVITGTCSNDVNSSDATVGDAEILLNKIAYARGVKLTGKMPNNGAVSGSISTKAGEYIIPHGFHDGSGRVSISPIEQQKIISGNIKSGVSILGVEGTYSGAEISACSVTVDPGLEEQIILPDEGFDYISSVTVNPISYEEYENSAGGTTISIVLSNLVS